MQQLQRSLQVLYRYSHQAHSSLNLVEQCHQLFASGAIQVNHPVHFDSGQMPA